MATMKTWYCDGGHNVFSSELYSDDSPPECGGCGGIMTTDSEGFDSTLELIEIRGIAAFERQEKIKKIA